MGQKIIRFSDLTGTHVVNDDDLVRIVDRQHFDLEDGPVEMEALSGELAADGGEDAFEGLTMDVTATTLDGHHHRDLRVRAGPAHCPRD
ncbi:hypothetical protein [Kitasatospora purpeofusca]|uniref:hypothetical protein n=1 Tax=Kitasatospora purpeofusca TaxID=67352 RepID=UPI003678FB15